MHKSEDYKLSAVEYDLTQKKKHADIQTLFQEFNVSGRTGRQLSARKQKFRIMKIKIKIDRHVHTFILIILCSLIIYIMNNKEKYLKYKKKYFNLKNLNKTQRGGTIFDIHDEIHFWGRQMSEHALFLYLGLEDVDHVLKNEAFEIHTKWNNFMNTIFYNKGITVTSKTVFLNGEELGKLDNISISDVTDLINLIEQFQNKILENLNQGKWIGWVYPSLVRHMLKENVYFKRKINGPQLNLKEEIDFANDHHSTEMGVTAQLIDPSPEQQPIIDIVRSYALKNMSMIKNDNFPKWSEDDENILKGLKHSDDDTILTLSLRFGKELTKFAEDTGQKIDSKQLKSIISPILANHAYREFARSAETLNSYKNETNISTRLKNK